MASKAHKGDIERTQVEGALNRQVWPVAWSGKVVLHPGDRGYEGNSETFRQFAQPLLERAGSYGEMRVDLSMAMPPHQRPRLLAATLSGMPIEAQPRHARISGQHG